MCFFKQKTAYEMRISDWSSDVCSSDLQMARRARPLERGHHRPASAVHGRLHDLQVADSGTSAVLLLGREIRLVGPGDSWRSEERRVGKECVSTCRSRWTSFP